MDFLVKGQLQDLPPVQWRDMRMRERNGMLLNGILTNSEVWYGLKEDNYTALEKVDEYLLRGTTPVKNSFISKLVLFPSDS